MFLPIRVARISNELGDTTNRRDLVMRQYEKLPYPVFDKKQLLEEELHYNKDEKSLAFVIRSQFLEKVNHYLYKGDQNFR